MGPVSSVPSEVDFTEGQAGAWGTIAMIGVFLITGWLLLVRLVSAEEEFAVLKGTTKRPTASGPVNSVVSGSDSGTGSKVAGVRRSSAGQACPWLGLITLRIPALTTAVEASRTVMYSRSMNRDTVPALG